MDVLTMIVLSFCFGQSYGQNIQRKLTRLQLDVDSLRALAVDLKLDIDGLQSWRNATVASPRETGGIDSDNEFVDYQLLGSFEQNLTVMEGRVSYIINGLEGEKMALRKMIEDIGVEVRQDIAKMQISVGTAVNETKFKEEKKEMEKATRQIEAKLNQHILSTESKDAEIKEHLNQLSKTLRTSIAEVLEQLKDLSARLDTMPKANGDTREQVTDPPKQTSTTVQDTTVTMTHPTKQDYARMKQDGWLQYNNSLYKLSPQKANFSNAVKSCEDKGAYLAEITDMAELKFLTANFDVNFFWLGATDLQTEGEWRWLSGQLVEDGNWCRGEPNNGGPNGQGCLLTGRIYQSKYNDYYCNSKFAYVCKIQ